MENESSKLRNIAILSSNILSVVTTPPKNTVSSLNISNHPINNNRFSGDSMTPINFSSSKIARTSTPISKNTNCTPMSENSLEKIQILSPQKIRRRRSLHQDPGLFFQN